jgi:hypothetical protein
MIERGCCAECPTLNSRARPTRRRPLPDEALRVVMKGEQEDGVATDAAPLLL